MEQIVFLLVDPVYKKFPELKGSAIALILLNGDLSNTISIIRCYYQNVNQLQLKIPFLES